MKKLVHLEGKVDLQAIRNATVVGTQYLWEASSTSQTASLLWTIKEPCSIAYGCPSILSRSEPPLNERISKPLVLKSVKATEWGLANKEDELPIKTVESEKGTKRVSDVGKEDTSSAKK